MKTIIITITIVFLVYGFVFSQEKQSVYILFDSSNDEPCIVTKNDSHKFNEASSNSKKHEKIKSNSNEYMYRFYICKEQFLLKKETKVDTFSIDYLKKINTSKISTLKKIINDINPLYPSKVFDKVFLIEKINDSTIVKYDVIWQYYIE